MFFVLCKVFNKLLNSHQRQILLQSKSHLSHTICQFSNNNMEKLIAVSQMCSSNCKRTNKEQVEKIVLSAAKQKACVRTDFIHLDKK